MEENVFVLFSGTVDPICLKSNETKGSQSNNNDSNSYWKNSQNSKNLIDRLKELSDKYERVHVFDKHGWGGKNIKNNREIAGQYLANRLCGSNGEKAYYEWHDKNVAFHLIGHSHGGNLINEFTKRAATAKEWPEQWKIKSITYLSTPFFNKEHQLNTKMLAPDCKIINVFNKFDLTQRIIADFSMYDLFSAIDVVSKDNPDLDDTIKKIKQTPFQNLIKELDNNLSNAKGFKKIFKVLELIINPGAYEINKDGANVYNKILILLDSLSQMLNQVEKIVYKLNTSLYYPSEEIRCDEKLKEKRLISNELYKEISSKLEPLSKDINKIKEIVENRRNKNDYKLIVLLNEICPMLKPIIKFFTIEVKTGKGGITNLIYCWKTKLKNLILLVLVLKHNYHPLLNPI